VGAGECSYIHTAISPGNSGAFVRQLTFKLTPCHPLHILKHNS